MTTSTTNEIADIFNQYGYLLEENTNKMLLEPSDSERYFALVRSIENGDKSIGILVGLNPIKMKTNSHPFACSVNHKVRLLKEDDSIIDVPISFCRFFNNVIDSETKYESDFVDVANGILKDNKKLDKLYDLDTEGGTEEVHKLHMLTSVVYGNTSEGSSSLLLGKLISYALDEHLDDFHISYLTEEEYNADKG